MNKHVRAEEFHNATQAAEGWPRRRFTIDEIFKAQKAGVFKPDERFELIGGEIVPMSPKGLRHETLKSDLVMYWGKCRPAHLRFSPETTFHLSTTDVPEPDLVVFAASTGLANLNGETALLIVEISDTTLFKDTNLKSRLYAEFGVREYWVINANTLETTVHKQPSGSSFLRVTKVKGKKTLVPEWAPELAVCLSTLKIDG
jgi:Uma2 family endonuclease